MKFIAVILAFGLVVAALTYLFMSIDNKKKNSKQKVVRNFVVRFDAAKEKYYITNQLETYDEPVTNSFGFRVMYKTKLEADFVAQKYND